MKRSWIAFALVSVFVLILAPPFAAQLVDAGPRPANPEDDLGVGLPTGDDELCDDADEATDLFLDCAITQSQADLESMIPTLTVFGSFCTNPLVSIGTSNGDMVELTALAAAGSFVTVDLGGNTDPGTYTLKVICPCETCVADVTLGAVGPIGPTGPQGPQGKIGTQGPQGKDGPVGEQGAQGKQGVPGAAGPKGDTGDQGDQGPQGKIGPQGDIGPTGSQGVPGEQGAQGKQGVPGAAGPKGDKGDQGDQGPQGKLGPQGDIGPTGSQGVSGEQGAQGKQGIPGAAGPKGDKGDQGDQGPQGKVGPEGDIGPTGPAGPAGLEGPQGPQGKGGVPGAQGPQGKPGVPGPTGPPGPDVTDTVDDLTASLCEVYALLGETPPAVLECACFDDDGDGYGFLGGETCPGGTARDCDDTDVTIFPGATELCDGVDNDCDGVLDPTGDTDGDGLSDCEEINVHGTDPLDADTDGGGASDGLEVANGTDPLNPADDAAACPDADADGFNDSACGGADCDDTNSDVFPGNSEICNGLDDDCDSQTDASDPELTLPLCENQEGVCQGSVKPPSLCQGGAWLPCEQWVYGQHSPYFGDGEICDSLDNDCNGVADEGFEEPTGNTCGTFVDLGVLDGSGTFVFSGLGGDQDADWYRIVIQEGDSSCHCCDAGCTVEGYSLNFWFDGNPGPFEYEVYRGACPAAGGQAIGYGGNTTYTNTVPCGAETFEVLYIGVTSYSNGTCMDTYELEMTFTENVCETCDNPVCQ